MPGPWEKYQAQGGGEEVPAVIYGAPKPGLDVDLERDRVGLERDRQALAIDRDRLRLAQEAEARQSEDARRKREEEDRKRAALNGAVDSSVEQARAASFYNRANTSNEKYSGLGVGAPGMGLVAAEALLPDAVVNQFRDPRRQEADAYIRDFVAATLRYESGAAIPPEELQNQARIFFPQPGDSEATIAAKAELRRTAIEGLRVGAGPAAANLRPTAGGVPTDPNSAAYLNSEEYRAKYRAEHNGEEPPLAVDVTAEIPDERGNSIMGDIDAAVRGAADVVTLGFADEIAAGARTALDGGTYQDNLARERRIDRYDEEFNPYARFAGQVGGGLALPTFGASGAGQLARIGAGYGGAYGFGSGENLDDRFAEAGKGAVIGGAGAGALGLIGARFSRPGGGGGGGGGAASELIAAAQRQGVPVLPADVGGPLTRRMTAGVQQTVFGSGPVARAARASEDAAANRLQQIASAEGRPARQEVLGEVAQEAAQNYIDQSGDAGQALYGRARELAGGARIQGRNAMDSIRAQVAELAETPNTSAPVIQGLERLGADIAENGELRNLSVDAMRRLRTNVRQEAQTEGLRATDYQRRANMVLDELSSDIASQLPPEAQAAFVQADRAWSERLNLIDDVMEQVIGRNGDRSAEAVANRLINMSRGDSARLRSFVNAIGPEEAGVVRGSIIQELGRARSGQQGAAGTDFSLQTFLTNWDKLPDRSRNLLFKGESREAIEDLARIAEGRRDTMRYANTSSTAGASNASDAVRTLSGFTAWGTMGGSAIAENLTARMLASPRFARWLARPPQDRGRALRRLAEIGAREPAIQPDINRLTQALSAAPNRAAAEDQNRNGRIKPPQ